MIIFNLIYSFVIHNIFNKNVSFFSLTRNCKFEKNAKIYPFVNISNSLVKKYTYIANGAKINNCEIGMYCSISRNVKIGLGNHPVNFISTSPIFYSANNALGTSFTKKNKFNEFKKTIIGNDVWIGINVVILDGVKIGNGSIIAAGSVVTKDVGNYTIIGGVPAKKIRDRFDQNIKSLLNKLRWWDMLEEDLININEEFCKEIDSENLKEILRKLNK